MPEVSLIPKDYKKEKISLESIFSKMGILIVVLVGLGLLGYVGLFFHSKSLNKQLQTLQGEIQKIDEQKDEVFEKEAVSLERVLKNLKTILKSHFYWSSFFSKFENLTVPQVSFSDFNGALDEDGFLTLMLAGKTSGYTYLAKQMKSFSQERFVSDINVSGINLSTEGGIEFNLNIIFSKDILLK